jgi:hypothetical protein
MSRQVSLSVNDMPINLDYFVENYIDHVVGGIITSLRDTGEIKSLELTIDTEGQVTINLNGADVPLKYFPIEIIKSTVEGMIAPLKGVDSVINKLEISIAR